MKSNLQHSDYRIRKLIGTLGLLLPIVLPIAKGEFLASISHYYYHTLSSLIFIIILSSFGLFLLSYRGYKIDTSTEKISDDFLTNIGGLAALIVVLIPTCCYDSGNEAIEKLCNTPLEPLFGHIDKTFSTIHLVAAGVFILCMGWMSRFKFTRGSDDGNHKLYKCCGNTVFVSVALIIICIVIEKWITKEFIIHDYYVYIFETTAVIPFGISWLVKGKAIDDIRGMTNRMFKRK
ncbi:MAG: hypothetical protein HRU50_03280 [Winogradskyella sp.]|uniref:hypothetical protein n=1 Tax=Winogradskyella sp. TaxID=1883156 RepID=UPI0025EC141E|nr:hypothetical protein [Winogradskyella sp.]NRB58947.1 hypothetical protein [Winogradskyella sp.]